MRIEGVVPKIDVPTRSEFIEKYVIPQKPVIIRGATKHWAAFGRWTQAYLHDKVGGKPVRVRATPNHIQPDLFSREPIRWTDMDLGDYIDLVWSDKPQRSYMSVAGDSLTFVSDYRHADPTLQSLCADFDIPDYIDREKIKTIGFWLSAKGLVASLHYDGDGSHNLNVQVKGKKRVLLFSPSQVVYPFSGVKSYQVHNFSQINIMAPDEVRFPGFRGARCIEAVIEEGEMLFIPSYWYHAVFHLGEVNINVNFWWQPDEFKLSKASLREAFFGVLHSALGDGGIRPSEIETAIENLPPQTVTLLQRIEDMIQLQYRI